MSYGIDLLNNMAKEYATDLIEYYSVLYNKNLMPENDESKAYFLLMILSKIEEGLAEDFPKVYKDYKNDFRE